MFWDVLKQLFLKELFSPQTCSQEKQRFLTDVLHEVMLLDGLSSSHPISQEVERATDIDRVFDWIAYKKVRELASKIAANISISLGARWK